MQRLSALPSSGQDPETNKIAPQIYSPYSGCTTYRANSAPPPEEPVPEATEPDPSVQHKAAESNLPLQ